MHAPHAPPTFRKTHLLQVSLHDDPYGLIPYVRLFIHQNPQEHRGLTITWSETALKDPSMAQFVTFSPYSDGITNVLVKQMLSKCLEWLSPSIDGAMINLAFVVTTFRYDGILQNINGQTYVGCQCAACPAHGAIATQRDAGNQVVPVTGKVVDPGQTGQTFEPSTV